MSYHVRRVEREIKDENELKSILERGKYGVIGLARNNEPYVVTLNYGYDKDENALFFHCGKEGSESVTKCNRLKSESQRWTSIITFDVIHDMRYYITV